MIGAQCPDVLILDPLVELHDAEENDNTALRAVMAKFTTSPFSTTSPSCWCITRAKGSSNGW